MRTSEGSGEVSGAGFTVEPVADTVALILHQRDRASLLLERLRVDTPLSPRRNRILGGGRREFRRWPTPDGVMLELHDGSVWHPVDVLDCGVPGVRVAGLPAFVGDGPGVIRLTTPDEGAILVLADVMWRDPIAETAGLFFEFDDEEDREAWYEGLIGALLARHALG